VRMENQKWQKISDHVQKDNDKIQTQNVEERNEKYHEQGETVSERNMDERLQELRDSVAGQNMHDENHELGDHVQEENVKEGNKEPSDSVPKLKVKEGSQEKSDSVPEQKVKDGNQEKSDSVPEQKVKDGNQEKSDSVPEQKVNEGHQVLCDSVEEDKRNTGNECSYVEDGMGAPVPSIGPNSHTERMTDLMKGTMYLGDMISFQTLLDEYSPRELLDLLNCEGTSFVHIVLWGMYGKCLDQGKLCTVLQALLNIGADINQTVKLNIGGTALGVAIEAGNIEMCEWLFDRGARIEDDAKHIHPSFSRDCYLGNYEMVEFLVQKGLGPQYVGCCEQVSDEQCDETHSCPDTALSCAVEGGSLEIVELLLNKYDELGLMVPWMRLLCKDVYNDKQEQCAIALLDREYQLGQDADDCFRPYHSYFHAVVSKRLGLLTSILVRHDPRVLQEAWLIDKDMPKNMIQSDVSYLQEIRAIPVPLQVQCIHAIRSVLGPKSAEKLDQLPLPKPLKELYIQQITLSSHAWIEKHVRAMVNIKPVDESGHEK